MQKFPTNHSIDPEQKEQFDSEKSLGTLQNNRQSSYRFNAIQLSSCFLGLVALGSSIVLAGCGGITANTNAQSGNGSAGGSTGSLSVSASTVPFGVVAIGSSATAQVSLTNSSSAAVTVSNLALKSSTFSVDGVGTLPATIAANSSATLNVHFSPSAVGDASAQLVVTDNTLTTPSLTIQLLGSGAQSVPALSGLTCTNASINSSGSDACSVTLASAAPTGGVLVDLSSSNAAVKVPSSVLVAANATKVSFNATAASVSSSQSATLTAAANSADETFALTVNPAGSTSAGATLSVSATSIAFGNVPLSNPATQSVTLQSTGTGAVTVSAATASGTGFTVSGATFPLTLNPNQSATLSVQFDPTATGADTGKLTISSNSSSNSSAVVSLSGTGVPLAVDLSWSAPSGSDSITGYNIYRATGSSSSFQKLNSSVNSPASFMDASVQASTTYQYYVTSIDSSGAESTPSNTATVAVP
jgi:Abnormal spindle-like microcephaly-assoc'd, ASPM-SPD-2-Hydin